MSLLDNMPKYLVVGCVIQKREFQFTIKKIIILLYSPQVELDWLSFYSLKL